MTSCLVARRPGLLLRSRAMVSGFKVALVGLALAFGAGCGGAVRTGPRPVGGDAPSAAGRVVPQPRYPTLNLPISARAESLPSGGYPVFITDKELLVGDPPRVVLALPGVEERSQFGVGGANKDAPGAGYVVPLGQAMAQRECETTGRVQPVAVVYVDAGMQYRVLIDVIYSLCELGYTDLFLATRHADTRAPNEAAGAIRIRARRTASHVVEVINGGLLLREQEGRAIGPDCAAMTATSPMPAPLNLAEVAACADKLVGPTGTLHLVADGSMAVQSIIPALEALRRDRAFTPTFPLPTGSATGATSEPQPADSSPVLTHGGTVGDATHVVSSLQPAFKACYQAELDEAPQRRGKVRLTIRVGASGDVSDVATASEGDLVRTIDCVKAAAERAKFAPPEGGSAVIKVPVTFVAAHPELYGQKPPCGAPRVAQP